MIVNMPGTTEIGGDYKVEHRVINCNYLPKSCFQIQSHSKRSGGGGLAELQSKNLEVGAQLSPHHSLLLFLTASR